MDARYENPRAETAPVEPTNARRMLPFIVVGSIGFAVDATVLLILTALAGWQPLWARLVSFMGAVTVTWLINRRFTFADRRALRACTSANEYLRYVLTQSVGAAINFAVFGVALWVLPALRMHLLIPLALGSICALCFNYLAMLHLVFPRRVPTS